jgi:hypothetical protein
VKTSTTTYLHRRILLAILAILSLIALMTLLPGCSTNAANPGALAENQRILASCDPAHPPTAWVGLDGTGSSAAENIAAERMAAVEQIVHQTAVCSGYLRVIVFSSSSTSTTALFDGSLRQTGATDNARLQRVPGAVSTTMETIRTAYGPAVAGLDQRGSDITAQYRLANEWQHQLGGNFALHLYLLTDGLQNTGVDLGAQALDQQQAAALAERVSVPPLPGATVVVAGLGRVAGPPPSSQVVEGLVAYYTALCHRTGAANCTAASDYQAPGQ